jgi:hypothetical protein
MQKHRTDYSKRLKMLGLTDLQIVTILSGWSLDSIEALLRGEITPPSDASLGQSIMACGID